MFIDDRIRQAFLSNPADTPHAQSHPGIPALMSAPCCEANVLDQAIAMALEPGQPVLLPVIRPVSKTCVGMVAAHLNALLSHRAEMMQEGAARNCQSRAGTTCTSKKLVVFVT